MSCTRNRTLSRIRANESFDPASGCREAADASAKPTRRPASAALRIALAAALAFSFIPIAGCSRAEEGEQAAEAPAAAGPTSASEDPGGSANARTVDYDTSTYLAPETKWADFEDGSNVLDIVQTHLNANAQTQTLDIVLEQPGAFAAEISPADIELSSGIAAWNVDSVSRTSDTTIEVVVSNSGQNAAESAGAAIAGVCVKARALDLQEPDMTAENEAMLEEYRKAEESGELADDVREEQTVTEAALEAEAEALEENSFYEAHLPFVHPSLLLDVEDTEANDDATVYRIIANEFTFPETIAATDFSLVVNSDELAVGSDDSVPEIVGVERLGDFEINVTVSADATAPASALAGASLVLAGDASGTGGDVAGSISLPTVWIDAEIAQLNGPSAAEAIAGGDGAKPASSAPGKQEGQGDRESSLEGDLSSVVVDICLHNAQEAADADELQIKVLAADGSQKNVSSAKTSVSEDGVLSVELDVNELEQLAGADEQDQAADSDQTTEAIEEATIFVDLPTVDAAYGGQKDPEVASVSVPLTARSIAALSVSSPMSVEVSEVAAFAGKELLSILASEGWSLARNFLFEGTNLAEISNGQLLSEIESMQSQINELSTTLDTLASKETGHYYANIVNNANRVIARVQAQYAVIAGPYEAAVKLKGEERETALAQIVTNNKSTIDSLLVDMGELYTIITKADAASNMGLVGVYDSMAANAYNWAAAAAPSRQAYRDSIAQVWSSCVVALYALLGTPEYEQAKSGSLALLQQQSKAVDTALSGQEISENSHTRAAGTFKLANGNSFVKATGAAYYCYTTNEWYTFCKGSDSSKKWDSAFFKAKKHGKFFDYDASMPFISWHNNKIVPSWESLYMGTSQAKLLLGRSPENRSLQQEIRMFNGTQAKNLITSASFNMASSDYPKNLNVWSCDTFAESTASTRSTFTSGVAHFDGYISKPLFKKSSKKTNSSTEVADMFVIAKVTLNK